MVRPNRSYTSAKSNEDKDFSSSGQDLPKGKRRKRKAEEDSDGPSSQSSSNSSQKTGASTSSASSHTAEIQDTSQSTSRKRKADKHLDESPQEPFLSKRTTVKQRRKKKAIFDEPTTSSGPSISVQDSSGQSLAAARTRRRRRTRAAVQEEIPDVTPDDDPVLALKGTNIRQFRAKYLKLKKIGQGGFGSVFAGVRKSDNLCVAIKSVVKKDILFTTVVGLSGHEYAVPSEVKLMLRAGGNDSSVGQNVAVSLIEWFELKTQVIIVMERPQDCKDLRDFVYMNTGAVSEEMAKGLIRNIILGTMELMSKGVFHRDLKCDNILLQVDPNDEYRVRIVDFGCSSELLDLYEGFYAGTFEYAPPEFYMEGWYRAESTCVWQLGALLYELLDADRHFTTTDYMERRLKFKRGLSKDCRHFLNSCLKLMPSQRLPLHQLLCHPWF